MNIGQDSHSLKWRDANQMNPELFIEQEEIIPLNSVLKTFATRFQEASDRQDIMSGAGVDDNFINSLKFNPTPIKFTNTLLTHFHRDLSGYNYMLFCLEKRTAQDWESLTNIKELVYKAQEAVVQGQYEPANELLNAIKVAVFRSLDLAKATKR